MAREVVTQRTVLHHYCSTKIRFEPPTQSVTYIIILSIHIIHTYNMYYIYVNIYIYINKYMRRKYLVTASRRTHVSILQTTS